MTKVVFDLGRMDSRRGLLTRVFGRSGMEMVETSKREDGSKGYFVGVVCGDELNKLKFK